MAAETLDRRTTAAAMRASLQPRVAPLADHAAGTPPVPVLDEVIR